MNSNDHDRLGSAERLTRLEELFMHLQQTVLDLNQVLISQSRRIDALEARLAQLASATAERAAEPAPPFDPQAERPPHY
jgi:uncharacterized coiled-coil protein SlyX